MTNLELLQFVKELLEGEMPHALGEEVKSIVQSRNRLILKMQNETTFEIVFDVA